MIIPAFRKTYAGRTVLDSPELNLFPGKICAVIGPNGSGKSTFARIVSGVLKPDGTPFKPPKGTVIRYMPQKSYSFRMSIEKNILLSGGDPVRAEKLMDALNLTSLKQQKITSLSGGESAKTAFVRVLMKPCDLLILDEPTAAMDMESAITAESLLNEYRSEVNCSVLLVTHDLFQARRMADEVLFFWQGKLCEMGKASDVLYHPENEITKHFLDYYGRIDG